MVEPHSISAGLDYPGIGPEHSFLKDFGRAEYVAISDAEALEGFKLLSKARPKETQFSSSFSSFSSFFFYRRVRRHLGRGGARGL